MRFFYDEKKDNFKLELSKAYSIIFVPQDPPFGSSLRLVEDAKIIKGLGIEPSIAVKMEAYFERSTFSTSEFIDQLRQWGSKLPILNDFAARIEEVLNSKEHSSFSPTTEAISVF